MHRQNIRLPRFLIVSALLAVIGLGVLLIGFYRVPWGGNFNPSVAGSASAWVGNLFTILGILALLYQLSQLRLSRVDETTREINSLYTNISTKLWHRCKTVDGKLVYIYIQNNGERKAMDIELDVSMRDGQPLPDSWLIERLHHFSLPPSMSQPIRALLFHVPFAHEQEAFGQDGRPLVRVSWTDPWSRRVEMVDNKPSIIIGQVT
jgi:hypothetical protein